MCRGTDAGGSVELHNMWSLIHNVSEYAKELRRCIGDALEKCGVQYAGSYSDRYIPLSKLHASVLSRSDCGHWVPEADQTHI